MFLVDSALDSLIVSAAVAMEKQLRLSSIGSFPFGRFIPGNSSLFFLPVKFFG
jgi:hypothetical protein